MNTETNKDYLAILREELVPALGCTEPIAIALAAATARQALGRFPENIEVLCSGNVIKNAMGVVVPTTGNMKGVDTSAVLGAVAGDPDRGLEVLAGVQPADVEQTRTLLQSGICTITLLEDTPHQLHIYVRVSAGSDTALAEICNTHTNLVRVEKNGAPLLEREMPTPKSSGLTDRSTLNLEDIFAFVNSVAPAELAPILSRQILCNRAMAEEGLKNPYGGQVGRTLVKTYGKDNIRVYARALAAAGSDARMGGCVLPVIINSGSGNQGMTASLPVIAYAEHLGTDQDTLLRALALSNLTALLQKREIGRLSAFCGVVCAACGSGAAITYLHGGTLETIGQTITNTLANIAGIICDGAKASCAAKIATSVDAAITAHEMAMAGNSFGPGEGIIKDSVEQTIESVGKMARNGMQQTDKEILRIMIED